MRPAGEIPGYARLEGQLQVWLAPTLRYERLDGVVEGETEKSIVHSINASLAHGLLPVGAPIKGREHGLHACRSSVNGSSDRHHAAITQQPGRSSVCPPEVIATVEAVGRPGKLAIQALTD